MHWKMVKDVSSTVHLDTMEAGHDYCVKAQTYVETINRSSSFSQTQCVRAQGNSQPSCLFPLCSHAPGRYPSICYFCLQPLSPVFFINLLPVFSLGEVKKEDLGVQAPTVAWVSLCGVGWQKISPEGVRRAAAEGRVWLHWVVCPHSLRNFAASVFSRWQILVARYCHDILCWLCPGSFDPAFPCLENK